MFLSTNTLNAVNNLTDSFSLLKYCHIILTKKIAVSCFERGCILCPCVGALIQSTCSLRMVLKLTNCLILCRRVAAKILADENLGGQEVVLAVTVAYLVLSAVIVVQKENRKVDCKTVRILRIQACASSQTKDLERWNEAENSECLRTCEARALRARKTLTPHFTFFLLVLRKKPTVLQSN